MVRRQPIGQQMQTISVAPGGAASAGAAAPARGAPSAVPAKTSMSPAIFAASTVTFSISPGVITGLRRVAIATPPQRTSQTAGFCTDPTRK